MADSFSLNPNYKAPNSNGFSLSTFREMNKVKLFLTNPKVQTQEIFNAYYKGDFSFTAQIGTGSYQKSITEFLNKQLGLVARSVLGSVTELYGSSMSGAFDAPYKPFIQYTEPVSFNIRCYLPIDNGITVNYLSNIEQPVNTILKVMLPSKDKKVSNFVESITNGVDSAVDKIFGGKQTMFWKAIAASWKGLNKDFFEGVYMLDQPIQFSGNNRLVLQVGPHKIPSVVINSATVSYSPVYYAEALENTPITKGYPAYATVDMAMSTLYTATVDTILGNTISYNPAVDSFISVNEVKTEDPEVTKI